MPVDLLDAPLRISWDFYSAAKLALSTEQLCQIATEVASAGVFFVSLENSSLDHPGIIPVIEILQAGGCQVSLVIDAEDAQLARLPRLPQGVSLYLDAAACIREDLPDLQTLAGFVRQIRDLQASPSLLWIPRSGQLPLILDFIAFCEQNDVPCFKLPNQKIDANPESPNRKQLPGSSDLQRFKDCLEQAGMPAVSSLKLEVHDLFLWELLQPLCGGERSEYGGCQAANSLGHVAASGDLLPCSAFPSRLGSLLEEHLHDLWQSTKRMAIIGQIAEVPPGCAGCSDFNICFGGCRGLSSVCCGDNSGRDLLCAERR